VFPGPSQRLRARPSENRPHRKTAQQAASCSLWFKACIPVPLPVPVREGAHLMSVQIPLHHQPPEQERHQQHGGIPSHRPPLSCCSNACYDQLVLEHKVVQPRPILRRNVWSYGQPHHSPGQTLPQDVCIILQQGCLSVANVCQSSCITGIHAAA